MNTLSLAWRNLLRNRRRSITTLLAMIVGANAVLLFGGYSRNITYGLQTDYVKYGGHLQIQREGYYRYGSGNPAAYGLAQYREIIAAIQQDPVLKPLVLVATPTLQLQGIAGNFGAGVSRTALGLGVVVEDQNRMRAWNGYDFPVQVPQMALTGTGPETAVLGTGLARVLQLCGPLKLLDCKAAAAQPAGPAKAQADLPADIADLGKLANGAEPAPQASAAAIEMLAATAQGAPNVARLQVVKAEEQGVKEFDDVYVGLHLAQAQQLVFGKEAAKATAIVLQLQHTDQIPAAKARLQQLLAERFPQEPVEVLDFSALNPFYGQALAMFATLFGFVALLIAAIVLFTVGNTMSMAVIERTVEIGTLRAMGLRRARLRRLFMQEGLLLGIVGAVLGVSIAASLAGLINHSGLTWTPPGRSPVPLIIRVWGETGLIAGTTVGLILVAALSAWLPSLRAARQNIVDALRHV
ncbi:ABC transporter permease [Mitsuaria sp. WAJ17]|uniref:ABC transporter permease n=1 Tax=Mitsuaria sp. WAJ17 TaxID=2761452 RepID=UPI001600793A|nr:FtsX-like permease family protein [Mitsuaria sp. WAJ17]MBB2487694.1 ABC transporter permease [Mitsuaria sp. WAJ17]